MATTLAYADSSVPVSKSQEEIRQLFRRFDKVDRFAFTEDPHDHTFAVSFMYEELPVNLSFNVWHVYDELTRERKRGFEPARVWAQAERTSYRHVAHFLKAAFNAVELGLVDLHALFLGHFQTPMGTLAEVLKPRLFELTSGRIALPAGQEGEA